MAPQVGLEPTTLRLTAGCSAIELLRSVVMRAREARLNFPLHNIIPTGRTEACGAAGHEWRFESGHNLFFSGRSNTSSFIFVTLVHISSHSGEVLMTGGFRLLWVLVCSLLLFAALWGANGPTVTTTAGPPKAKPEPVEDTLHGHKIVDPYRYLENASSPETQEYVRDEMAYTRSLLDPLPGRDKIHARLEQLLTIGTITTPQPGGNYYFYTRRDGAQNQPVLYAREGFNGKDRVLVDANQLAADGTIALDWWDSTHDGKYVAYGMSPSGSEMSTLQVIETATGKLLPDTIERTRACSLAWKLDDSGFYYTRYPKKGEVAEGQEVYNRHVFYHALG